MGTFIFSQDKMELDSGRECRDEEGFC
jgi:hypothetical protein